jgi:hypothetical protein
MSCGKSLGKLMRNEYGEELEKCETRYQVEKLILKIMREHKVKREGN